MYRNYASCALHFYCFYRLAVSLPIFQCSEAASAFDNLSGIGNKTKMKICDTVEFFDSTK